jgi:GNAT superfamily N-acetyltransferase
MLRSFAMAGESRVTIALETRPEDVSEVRRAVADGLIAFNSAESQPYEILPITIAARDDGGAIVGGLAGEIRPAWKWLYVQQLWISQEHRQHGIGKQLLRAAEAEARRLGCLHAALDTLDFQARPFYEKEGYRVWAVRDDYPPGHQQFYMRKALT